ncbi:hypothetical protein MMC13_000171 [Lambiella insularis]|nr:hypothetical protein [Lambiella insularis]
MSLQFCTVPLFGGALSVKMPSTFVDASNFRPVPDNQEVYLDADGLVSIIVEITERVTQVATNEEAMQYHLEDYVDGSSDTLRVYQRQQVTMAKLPANTPAQAVIATTHSPSASANGAHDFVGIVMLMIRLAAQESDIIVTINVPHFNAREVNMGRGRPGPMMEEAGEIRDAVVASFEVRDLGLFGQ